MGCKHEGATERVGTIVKEEVNPPGCWNQDYLSSYGVYNVLILHTIGCHGSSMYVSFLLDFVMLMYMYESIVVVERKPRVKNCRLL